MVEMKSCKITFDVDRQFKYIKKITFSLDNQRSKITFQWTIEIKIIALQLVKTESKSISMISGPTSASLN